MSGFQLLLQIGGGVALLLWAARLVRTGIMRGWGGVLRQRLGRVIEHRGRAFLMGIGLAALLQSATATAILATSFAGSGLLKLAPGLALMLGADVGSTLVVQVLAFDLHWLAPALLIVGVVVFLSSERRLVRQFGRVVLGLGLMLLSLGLIVEASEPLRDSATLQMVIRSLSGDAILALVLAALLTWLAHSSVAIVLLIISLASIRVVPPDLALVLVLGANVGSSLIPLALTGTAGPVARRMPLGNLLYRLVAALIALSLVTPLASWLATLDMPVARQLAHFHTGFNLALALVFLPTVVVMARFLERVLPAPLPPPGEGRSMAPPSSLDEAVLVQPRLALAAASREILRMADRVESMLHQVPDVLDQADKAQMAAIAALDTEVDEMHRAIKLYLARLARGELGEEESRRVQELMAFAINLEHIGDVIEKSILDLAAKKRRTGSSFSDPGWKELMALHEQLLENLRLAITVFMSGDLESARQLMAEKERFRRLEQATSRAHIDRLQSGLADSIETSALHLDLVRDLRHINSHLAAVAYPILDQSGELRDSRMRVRPGAEEPGE